MTNAQRQDDGDRLVTLRWVFVRDDHRIDVSRSAATISTEVDVSEGGVTRVFRCADRSAVVAFQEGFEQALIQTGWTLAAFAPERRAGQDRRFAPRGADRRDALTLVSSRPASSAEAP